MRSVEQLTVKRQLLCGRTLGPYSGIAISDRGYKASRRINRADRVRRQPPCQLAGKRPRAAANVEHALTGLDAGEICEPRRQWRRVATHEPVVLLGPDAEVVHRSTLATVPVARLVYTQAVLRAAGADAASHARRRRITTIVSSNCFPPCHRMRQSPYGVDWCSSARARRSVRTLRSRADSGMSSWS